MDAMVAVAMQGVDETIALTWTPGETVERLALILTTQT